MRDWIFYISVFCIVCLLSISIESELCALLSLLLLLALVFCYVEKHEPLFEITKTGEKIIEVQKMKTRLKEINFKEKTITLSFDEADYEPLGAGEYELTFCNSSDEDKDWENKFLEAAAEKWGVKS